MQDADRLEALGAIGLARVFAVSGSLGVALFDGEDPFAQHRPLDDKRYALDHFQTKLLKLPQTMQTTKVNNWRNTTPVFRWSLWLNSALNWRARMKVWIMT